ncbi:hypothetical protein JYU04_03585 [Dehalococcoides mccartyi]|nr:hypothetical protein [Dehalococcoides mccartyi]
MLNTRDQVLTRRGSGPATALPKTRSPRIRLVTPRPNFLVGGDVFILVDAISDHEPVADLKVEIQIDGATLISAKYSPLSGYYGAIWDCSGEQAGSMHTLIARVTDTAGNSRTALATVSVG